MRFREYPLLNAPNLVVIILRQGAAAPATLADCASDPRRAPRPGRRASALRPEGRGRPPRDADRPSDRGEAPRAGRRRLRHHRPGQGRARGAPRGPRHRRSDGLPGVRPLHPRPRPASGRPRPRPRLDPRAARLSTGASMPTWSGRGPRSDNPYPADSADHLAWENGWSEGLDEDVAPDGRARPALLKAAYIGSAVALPREGGEERLDRIAVAGPAGGLAQPAAHRPATEVAGEQPLAELHREDQVDEAGVAGRADRAARPGRRRAGGRGAAARSPRRCAPASRARPRRGADPRGSGGRTRAAPTPRNSVPACHAEAPSLPRPSAI